ncbi:MAG TPA: TylF/MycF/NovP-related O-methyltransferase [Gammaproteobacteria bacterium]|nr:TylF/MycF/NovP-related O-methyltransferase [Gammaproteobacteria bacterium]
MQTKEKIQNISERQFDGRKNFAADDQVEQMLESHFEKFNISKREIWRNFQLYTRRVFLKRFLAHYELYQKVVNLPGDIVELGVYRGSSLMTWANLLEIRNMGDRHKKIVGFDNFKGFGDFDEKDGIEKPEVGKKAGGFDSTEFESQLRDVISIYDEDRFIPYKPRVHLVKGDIEKTIPEYLQENPGMRICLLHFDVDLYKPTKVALEHMWDLVVPGGVVIFDEYAIPPWEGESRAVDEFFAGKKIKIERFDWASNPGGFIIKE